MGFGILLEDVIAKQGNGIIFFRIPDFSGTLFYVSYGFEISILKQL